MLDHDIRTTERSGDAVALRHARVASVDEIARCHAEAIALDPVETIRALPLADVEAIALREIAARNPRSRLSTIIRYIKNTSSTKVRSCVLCGWSEQYAGGWRRTDASERRERDHRVECLTAFRARLVRRAQRAQRNTRGGE